MFYFKIYKTFGPDWISSVWRQNLLSLVFVWHSIVYIFEILNVCFLFAKLTVLLNRHKRAAFQGKVTKVIRKRNTIVETSKYLNTDISWEGLQI